MKSETVIAGGRRHIEKGRSLFPLYQVLHLILPVFIITLALAGCSGPLAVGGADVTLYLGGAARLVGGYPPDNGTEALLEYVVTFSGPGFHTAGRTGPGPVRATLAPGAWDIAVEARLYGDLFAEGSAKAVRLEAGKENPVTITMTRSASVIYGVRDSAEWNDVLDIIRNGGDDKSYIINITDNFSVEGIGAASTNPLTFETVKGLTVTIKGNYTLSLTGAGSLLNIAEDQTVILRDIRLKGYSDNNYQLVVVSGGLTMEGGASVTGNTIMGGNGGGVHVKGGAFVMGDTATVSGNNAKFGGNGGGVFVESGSFIMRGGASVTGNNATDSMNGAGVFVGGGTFLMRDNSTVSRNTAAGRGGGVYVRGPITGVTTEGGTFRVAGGTVFGNDGGADSNKANDVNSASAALYAEADGAATYGPDGTGSDLITGTLPGGINYTIKVVNGARRQ